MGDVAIENREYLPQFAREQSFRRCILLNTIKIIWRRNVLTQKGRFN